jgi:hypothetical protein
MLKWEQWRGIRKNWRDELTREREREDHKGKH